MKMAAYLKGIFHSWMTAKLKASGYSSFAARALFNNRVADLFNTKTTTLAQKIWAQKRGFFSETAQLYGLTEDNCNNYLSDFDYYRLHPINGSYSKWIDDKLTLRHILEPFSEYFPEYYYHLCKGEVPKRNSRGEVPKRNSRGEVPKRNSRGAVLRLVDCPDAYSATVQGVLQLLQDRGSLAAKLAAGSLGAGFFKLAWDGKEYWINKQPAGRQDVEDLLNGWLNSGNVDYLITEYLQAHRDLQKILPGTPGMLRIVVLRDNGQPPCMVHAYKIFPGKGTVKTGGPTFSGMNCLVDLETGRFFDGNRLENNKIVDCRYHPDTGVKVEGFLPHWHILKETIFQICDYIPQVRWMGLDIIITDEGPKIIEINSHPGISFTQYFHPFLKDEKTSAFFHRLLEEKRNRLPG